MLGAPGARGAMLEMRVFVDTFGWKPIDTTGGHPAAVEGAPFRTQPMNRFPPPWRIVELAGSFTVQDATGQNVAWFYFLDGPTVAPSAAVPLKERARRRAVNFAGPLPACRLA